MDRMTLKIEGMSCGHCVGAVRRALDAVPGVEVEEVAIGEARIAFDPATTSTAAITEAIEDEGYQVAATEQ